MARKGSKLSEQHRKNISKALMGNQYNKGNKASVETRKKMSEIRRGKRIGPCPEERRKKIAESVRAYYAHNPERKEAIAISLQGRKLPEEHKAKIRKGMEGKHVGEDNPFYGKKHKEETLKIISRKSSLFMKGRIFSEEHKKNISASVLKRIASRGDFCLKNSKRGYSGRYKGSYFRSLGELSYIVNVLEKQKLIWESAEAVDLAIRYEYEGRVRYYLADFLVEEKRLVEIKPKRLQNDPEVLAKAEAAKHFCSKMGLIYEIISMPCMPDDEINYLVATGTVVLDEYSMQKWVERMYKKSKKKCFQIGI